MAGGVGLYTGGINSPQVGSTGLTQQQIDQSNAYRQQSQQAAYQKTQQDAQQRATQLASDKLLETYHDPTWYHETDGVNMNSNNGATLSGSASGSRSGGGLSIGGGTYPDVSGLMAQFKTQNPQVQGPGAVAPPSVPGSPDTFAHAKDVNGRQGNKAIEALQNFMTSRGLSDSGMTADGAANILGGVGRMNAQEEFNRANIDNSRQWDANKLAYQGQITQNGQGYQGAIQQRGQDVDVFLNLLRQLY